MVSKRNLWLSLVTTLAIGLVAFSVTVSTTGGFLVWSDGFAYFFHARSLVVDGDTDITNEVNEFDRRYPEDSDKGAVMESIRAFSTRDPGTGRIVAPWPIGMGLVLAPFYAIGLAVESLVAFLQGREADSYGITPQYFFALGSLVFGLLGFWAMYLSCRRIADESRSYIAALATVFGGPVVFYVFVNPSMAHAVSFGLASALVLIWGRQWKSGTRPKAIVLPALLVGLLVTIRLQNAIFGVLLAALVVRELWRSGWLRSLSSATAGLAACAIPIAVLAVHTAKFGASQAKIAIQHDGVMMFGSYPIHPKSPYFFDVLFSCRHGAFHWAPILAIGLIGLFWAARRESWAPLLLIVLALHVYLIGGMGIAAPNGGSATFDPSNWNDHWNGAPSFGMRYLTECAPIFALGLASLLNRAQKIPVRLLLPIGLSILVAWNGLLILAYGLNTFSRSGCLSYGDMWGGVGKAIEKMFRVFS